MRRLPFVPSPIAFLSGLLSFGLLVGTGAAVSAALPHLIELLETSPHLAMLGVVALVVAPAVMVTLVHRATHRAMDSVDHATDAHSFSDSVWAGVNAWLIIVGTSVLARLLMLVAEPPKLDPDTAIGMLTREAARLGALSNLESAYPVLWIVIAAELFELERRTRRPKR